MKPVVEQLLTKICLFFDVSMDVRGETKSDVRSIIEGIKKIGSCDVSFRYNRDVLTPSVLNKFIEGCGLRSNYLEHGEYFVMLLQETAQQGNLNARRLIHLLESNERKHHERT